MRRQNNHDFNTQTWENVRSPSFVPKESKGLVPSDLQIAAWKLLCLGEQQKVVVPWYRDNTVCVYRNIMYVWYVNLLDRWEVMPCCKGNLRNNNKWTKERKYGKKFFFKKRKTKDGEGRNKRSEKRHWRPMRVRETARSGLGTNKRTLTYPKLNSSYVQSVLYVQYL